MGPKKRTISEGLRRSEFPVNEVGQQRHMAAAVLQHLHIDQAQLDLLDGLRDLVERVHLKIVLAVEFLLLVEVENHQPHGLGGHPLEQGGERAQEHQAVAHPMRVRRGETARRASGWSGGPAPYRRRRVCGMQTEQRQVGNAPGGMATLTLRSPRLSLASMVQSLRQTRPARQSRPSAPDNALAQLIPPPTSIDSWFSARRAAGSCCRSRPDGRLPPG